MSDPTPPVLPTDEVADIVTGLEDENEALRSQLAAAHDVIRRLRGGWEPDIPCIGPEVWCWFHPDEMDPVPMTPAERAVLDAADATPTEAHDGE